MYCAHKFKIVNFSAQNTYNMIEEIILEKFKNTISGKGWNDVKNFNFNFWAGRSIVYIFDIVVQIHTKYIPNVDVYW